MDLSLSFLIPLICLLPSNGAVLDKSSLKEQSLEMFRHAYWSYMNYAYPADELMPLSCNGRFRGVTPCRGDVDDSLGNFSLTLIDTLDTLLVVGEVSEFERAVWLVVRDVKFDTDVIVSVFETNIRVLGGLLSGHLMAKLLQSIQPNRLTWYEDELLQQAVDVATRLLPAFNTTTGVPYPRINLKHGIVGSLRGSQDTCTACGGTMILEFAALSRLTGNSVFEEKAHQAMDFLWQQRHRGSDLMGTVLNIHSGDWIRRDSGVGAGIDSYYEYCLKAYVLLGNDAYLHRFNKHYEAVMKYISQGPVFVDVHMHKPTVAARSFMDSLLAFWPGLQVLKGDLKSAIETHEMLYQVVQRHNFLPEAFTHDFQVHWAQHPLRPEFVESTYFLYKATKDPHYLDVGAKVMEAMNRHLRVPCGFAGIKDVRTGVHEDRMDSFVLAETFKYLYMLFAEKEDLLFDPDNYIFTTEAHLLPLSIASTPPSDFKYPMHLYRSEKEGSRSCPNTRLKFKGELSSYARLVRNKLKNLVNKFGWKEGSRESCLKGSSSEGGGVSARDFNAGNPDHVEDLRRMGIQIQTQPDGRVQLIHSANSAASSQDAQHGIIFMQEMIQLAKQQENEVPHPPRVVQVMSSPHLGLPVFLASPAQFGMDLADNLFGVEGEAVMGEPFRGCQAMRNVGDLEQKIVVLERGDCMFIEKVVQAQLAQAAGVLVIDNALGTSFEMSSLFAMSGDGKTDVSIPAAFLFREEGDKLRRLMRSFPGLRVRIGEKTLSPNLILESYLKQPSIFDRGIVCKKRTNNLDMETIEIRIGPDGQACMRTRDGLMTCFPGMSPDAASVLSASTTTSSILKQRQQTDTNCAIENDGRKFCVENIGGNEVKILEDGNTILVETRPLPLPASTNSHCLSPALRFFSNPASIFTCPLPVDDGSSASMRWKQSDCSTIKDTTICSRRVGGAEAGVPSPRIIRVETGPGGQKLLKLEISRFVDWLTREQTGPHSAEDKAALSGRLMEQLSDEWTVNGLLDGPRYRSLLQKLVTMSLGDSVFLTDEDEDLLNELGGLFE